MDDGQRVEEDVSASVKENFVQYHTKDEDGEVWVNDDFNRVSNQSINSGSSIPLLKDGNNPPTSRGTG